MYNVILTSVQDTIVAVENNKCYIFLYVCVFARKYVCVRACGWVLLGVLLHGRWRVLALV